MKKKLISLVGFSSVLSLAPLLAQAAACGTPGDVGYVLCQISNIINTVVPILIALGVVYFIWGVAQYAIGTDEEAKKSGREKMIYGLIALLVIVSIWGLVSILQNTFGITSAGNTNTVFVPCIPLPGYTTC